MSEHRGVFSPVARSSFLRRRRWVAVAAAALGAGGLIFGGLAQAASPSDPAASAGVDVWADVDGGWTGDELSARGAGGSAYEGETVPFDASMSLAASAETRSSGADAIVDTDASTDLNVEHDPDTEPAPIPDPDLDPIPPFDPDQPLPLDPDPDLDPTPLPDPISVLDPGPVVLPDPGGVVPPDFDPPGKPGTNPGDRCASSATTPRCGESGNPGSDTGDPDHLGSTTEVYPATVVAGGGNDRVPAPDEGILGSDAEQAAPAPADSPASAALAKTGGGLPTWALRLLILGAVGRALLRRTGRWFRPSAVAARP